MLQARRVATASLLVALVALAGCFGGGVKDPDGDHLATESEETGWQVIIDTFGKRVTRHVDSDPEQLDTDLDGVSDGNEFQFPNGLDPRNPDSDGDGLSDCQETIHSVLADCEDPAFNGPYDGGLGTQPNNADSEPGGRYWRIVVPYDDPTHTIVDVSWGDGLSDGLEQHPYNVTIMGGVRSITTSPKSADTDRDGLDDGEEALVFHTDGRMEDTDGDGCKDGVDALPDRVETYRLGLQSLTVTRTGSLPTAHVSFTVEFQGPMQVPASGGIFVANGQTTDIRAQDPAPHRPDGCTYSPRDWIAIRLVAQNTDPGGGLLDLASKAQPDGAPDKSLRVWFRAATGELSWTSDGTAPMKGPLRVSGNDGELVFSPSAS